MSPSKKRASPGAEEAKNGAVEEKEVVLSEEDEKKLTEIGKEQTRIELIVERRAQEYFEPFYVKRRSILKSIPNFWSHAMENMPGLALHIQYQDDRDAMSYLEDFWLVRDKTEPRCFTLEFYFKPNPYFTDSVLRKEYKFLPSPANETPDADGITPSMIEFSWERDAAPQKIKINWKDESKNLTKTYPRVVAEGVDDAPVDPGSFFNYFEHADDPFEIGSALANDIFPDAIEYFTGQAGKDYDFGIDSEDDDEDNDEEEIDLEKPRKKQRTG